MITDTILVCVVLALSFAVIVQLWVLASSVIQESLWSVVTGDVVCASRCTPVARDVGKNLYVRVVVGPLVYTEVQPRERRRAVYIQ